MYQINRMSFGLINAPASFQKAMDILLAKFRWKTGLFYLEDDIIFSLSSEEHIDHVEEVLKVLQGAGVQVKLPKCDFFVESIK